MAALKKNFEIYEGDTNSLPQVVWKQASGTAVNLTGYTARLHVRKTIASTTTLVALTESAGITLGGAAGTIDIVFSAAQSAAIVANSAYDLELTDGSSVVTTIMYGNFEVIPQVSRT